jgi:tetratricopeptide (TPR) repeat protein
VGRRRRDSFSEAVKEADRLFDDDRIDDAEDFYLRAAAVAPDAAAAAWARKNAGICARRSGKAQESLELALGALQRLPEDDEATGLRAEIWLLIGNGHADLHNFAEAEQALDIATRHFHASKRFEDEIQAHLSMTRVFAERGDTSQAIALLETVDPTVLSTSLRSQVLNNLGLLYMRSGRTHEAVDLLRNDVALCETREDRYGAAIAGANLGAALADLGRNSEAREVLDVSVARLLDIHADAAAQEVERLLEKLEHQS